MLTGETSRSALTAPSGKPYAKVIVTNPANSDTYWCYVPATRARVVMFAAHGAGGNENYIEHYAPAAIPLAMDRGWTIVCPRGIGAGWGNDAALGYYVAAQTWATAQWGRHHALLHGGSMGGLTVALLAANHLMTNLAAWAAYDGAVSLSYAYGAGFSGQIKTAYGIPGTSYAVATEGHDPVLRPASDYDGQRVLLVHSTGDSTITKAANSDVLFDLIDATADVTYLTTTGGHSTVNTGFLPAESDAFFSAAIDAAPPLGRRTGLLFV